MSEEVETLKEVKDLMESGFTIRATSESPLMDLNPESEAQA